jgi:hypothetical protein
MFVKCYYHLHPSKESDNGFVNKKMDDDNNLDILKWQ